MKKRGRSSSRQRDGTCYAHTWRVTCVGLKPHDLPGPEHARHAHFGNPTVPLPEAFGIGFETPLAIATAADHTE